MTGVSERDLEALRQRLVELSRPSRKFSLLLAACAILVAFGLWLLIQQNATIREQQITILRQKDALADSKRQLEISAGKLVREVQGIPADVARSSPAIAAAQAQAVAVDNQIVKDSPNTPVMSPPAEPSPAPFVLAKGPNTGWDVDVFWCEGPAPDQDYTIARDRAIVLANYAASNKALAPGIRLGRIRLRTWPLTMKDGSFKGLSVVSDGSNGEDAVQAAIVTLFAANGGRAFAARHSVGKPTPYILSVFACNGWL